MVHIAKASRLNQFEVHFCCPLTIGSIITALNLIFARFLADLRHSKNRISAYKPNVVIHLKRKRTKFPPSDSGAGGAKISAWLRLS